MLLPWVPELKLHRIEDASMEGLAKFARRKKAEAIILGLTYDELDKGIPKAAIPVMFPLCGMGGPEIGALIRRIRAAKESL